MPRAQLVPEKKLKYNLDHDQNVSVNGILRVTFAIGELGKYVTISDIMFLHMHIFSKEFLLRSLTYPALF